MQNTIDVPNSFSWANLTLPAPLVPSPALVYDGKLRNPVLEPRELPVPERVIALRRVEVHNLQQVDLDLPHYRWITFCGLSGSGKSSLAFDTLYAEGQRRYIESFSAYTRQFLERLEKPAAERIDGLPPAIAIAADSSTRSNRSTVGTATETHDYLRLLFARIGRVICRGCGRWIRRESPETIVDALRRLPEGTRFLLAFESHAEESDGTAPLVERLRSLGFQRVIADEKTITLEQAPADWNPEKVFVVVDRLTAGAQGETRLRDSLETALGHGAGHCSVWLPAEVRTEVLPAGVPATLDGQPWRRLGFGTQLRCDDCGIDYPTPEPRLFSFNSPLGACAECEGFGNVIDLDWNLIVPDASKSLREGAIAPWNTPAYEHELKELLALARDYELPVDVPFGKLTEAQKALIVAGVPERKFGGLNGFFAWLERRKYKMHNRVFLSRWRSYRTCPTCEGRRLNADALSVRVGGKNLAELSAMKVGDALGFLKALELSNHERQVARTMLEQVQSRLNFLVVVGLDYLTLDRSLRTLSGGESQRVALASAIGSSLVNMLYVLDEPSAGLHPRDTDRLIGAIRGLLARQNTVIVVEHEEAMIRAADQVVEIGPGAGQRGGRVVFQGTPEEMIESPDSLTGDYLAGRRIIRSPQRRRTPNHGWIRLAGARGNNLKNLTVEFPLGMLCVVTGVSGAGKSTLVQDTLYPALCKRMKKETTPPLAHDDVLGDGQIGDVVLVDQAPIGRSPRSNPVTYIKAFDEIRAVFAATVDAKTRNYTATHFSFNNEAGRCSQCEGDGYIQVDMQFLADVFMKCSQCHGRRYRREILDINYRGRNIADVLDMTVREAFTFFRGHAKVQARLKRLIDVGLDYLRLGQPANTLSGGESQRLKLAAYISAAKRGRTLFLLDEPTTGLHFADIVQLLDCFEALLAVGHSLIVVEHNLHLIKSADYLIDLGPGAADEGGEVVATGTPENVARQSRSITGRYLAKALAEAQQAAASV
ncbi:MAG: excinuclease ABC subunit UvrA [Planctomycetes bacterium]|nr:excinuclease ABC subunit UvrA [Planctomycetota bacterium]